jgi:two-component system cell cycle response regulator DivK
MRTKTLLVVDDEPTNLDLIRMAVEDAGLAVRFVAASNGQEALRQARDLVPDLVLMDMKMPGLDGWEATRRLKADPRTATIPVVALTAQAMAGDLERALAAGCDDCLTKPLDLRMFLAMLRERLG